MNRNPPRYAHRFLRWFCREDYLEEIEGDLMEVYQKMYAASPRQAKMVFIVSVIRLFRPAFIRTFQPYSPLYMYGNYFKISWRNLVRQKSYSFIKIGGLALGIAACCLIALYLRHELSYDKQYPTDVYRMIGVFRDDDAVEKSVYFPPPFAAALKEFPEVISVARYNDVVLFDAGEALIRRTDASINTLEDRLAYVDSSLLTILKLPMVYGSREHALDEPRSIVITRSKADKYYPGVDPTGQLLIINDQPQPYKIGGVIEDFPSTSHIQFDFLVTLTELEFWRGEQSWWGASNYPTYIKLRPGVDPNDFADKVTKGIIEKYIVPHILANSNMSEAQVREHMSRGTLTLQPLTDIYLGHDVDDGLPHGDPKLVWAFAAIAIAILVIACINFINLSTARSANRAKEVGLRKVMGSYRSHLVNQFMTESVLFVMISFVAGIALATLLLPFFNAMTGKSIAFPWTEWQLLVPTLGVLVVVALLAGVYPSFYLSAFRPIQVLKGNLRMGSRNPATRSTLVIFQFATSIVLIVGTFIIYRQMEYMLNKKLGFEKEQVVLLQGTGVLADQVKAFKDELRSLSHVSHVSVSDYLPIGDTKRNGNTFWREDNVRKERGVYGQFWRADEDYVETLGLRIVEGRDLDPNRASDSSGALINQEMVRQLMLEKPIGARITNSGDLWTVVGVVEDFHFESMKQKISPICIVLGTSPDMISVKVNTSNFPAALAAIEKVWKQFAPQQPFNYSFLDERFAAMYADIERTGFIFTCFAVFAVIVACLGLFGLSSFMVEQRSKEISIRRVLGASVQNIFRLLTHHFVKLVVFSFILAVPAAWYLMDQWLRDYAFRIDIPWDVFLYAGGAAVLIALLTVSVQSLKAAFANPVESLRSE